MAAELTPARIAELVREAQIAFCLDKYPSFEVALVRKVEAALATQQATQGAEPDGWLYVMHMEGGQKNKAFSDDRYDFPTHSPFGRRGRDYSEEYEVTEHPIHLTAPPPTAEVEDAITSYLEARDALDNREMAGINGEPWDVLQRRVHAARIDLDAALQSEAQAGKGDGHDQ